MERPNKFSDFLHEVETTTYPTNTTSTGNVTIQQSIRNDLRKKGVAALKEDLAWLLPDFDIVETKEGIVIVAENEDFTFSWELKNTIKSIDFDPFVEASAYDEACAEKENKRLKAEREKQQKLEEINKKREAKLAAINKKRNLEN